jgi:hypothetical protein
MSLALAFPSWGKGGRSRYCQKGDSPSFGSLPLRPYSDCSHIFQTDTWPWSWNGVTGVSRQARGTDQEVIPIEWVSVSVPVHSHPSK